MRRILLAAYRIRGPIYLVAVALLVVVALSTALGLGDRVRQVAGIVAIGALCAMALCFVLVLLGPRALPSRETVTVAPPLRGRWLGMNSPASKVPSHGIRMYGQAYAIDLVYEPADVARPLAGDDCPAMRSPQEYPAFGQPVLAMMDGTVVRASGWMRDHRTRSNRAGLFYMMLEGMIREVGGPGFILGNHVTVRGDDGIYASVAHMQQHSVTVGVGDRVRAGQQIGRCGNSGNSSEPHVHAQLADRASPWTAQGIPMAFAAIGLGDDAAPVDGLPPNEQHMLAQ